MFCNYKYLVPLNYSNWCVEHVLVVYKQIGYPCAKIFHTKK